MSDNRLGDLTTTSSSISRPTSLPFTAQPRIHSGSEGGKDGCVWGRALGVRSEAQQGLQQETNRVALCPSPALQTKRVDKSMDVPPQAGALWPDLFILRQMKEE